MCRAAASPSACSCGARTAAWCARWRRCRWPRTSPSRSTRRARGRAASTGAQTSRASCTGSRRRTAGTPRSRCRRATLSTRCARTRPARPRPLRVVATAMAARAWRRACWPPQTCAAGVWRGVMMTWRSCTSLGGRRGAACGGSSARARRGPTRAASCCTTGTTRTCTRTRGHRCRAAPSGAPTCWPRWTARGSCSWRAQAPPPRATAPSWTCWTWAAAPQPACGSPPRPSTSSRAPS
mmetsp:Transcript_38188/g.96677  ORF Transcript_38188/g.96677 Transcript_38188/m.96677 type:complete len:238 (+) Transcript_38188:1164-1877(+)